MDICLQAITVTDIYISLNHTKNRLLHYSQHKFILKLFHNFNHNLHYLRHNKVVYIINYLLRCISNEYGVRSLKMVKMALHEGVK